MMTNSLCRRAAALILGVALVGSMVTAASAAPPAVIAGAVMTAPPTVVEARELQGDGQWEAAAKAWKQIVDDDPDNGTAWFNLGYCLHAAGHLDHAIKAHKKASTFDDYHGIALYNLGCAHALNGNPDKAFEALDAAQAAGFRLRGQVEGDSDLDSLRDDPRYQAYVSGGRGGIEGKLEEIAQHIQQFIERQVPQIQRRFAMFAQRAGEHVAQMLGQLQQKLAHDERFAGIAQHLQEMMGGQHSGSAHDAERHEAPTSKPKDSDDPAALLNQARRLQQDGKWLEAASAYHQAAKADPENPAPWFGLSYCLHMGGEYEKAIKAHQKAATFDQTRGIALYNLACAYSLTGHVDEAIEALETARAAGFDLKETIATDSDLENLRDDPRYAKLLTELGVDL